MKTIIRTARERRPGSLGYAEAMLVFYNKKCKYRLSMRKLYGTASDEDDLDDDDDSYTVSYTHLSNSFIKKILPVTCRGLRLPLLLVHH